MTSDVTARSPGGAGGLRRAAEEYLATRRALGFMLSTQGRLLLDFVDHCERHAIATVTTDVAVAWAIGTTRSRDPLWWARRLMVVRIFARHLRALDPSHPGAADGRAAACVSTHHALPVLGASRLADLVGPQAGCGPGCAALTYAARDRAARLLRPAHQRGLRPGPGRRRSGRGCADRAGVEVRQVPDRARARQHPRRAADLRRPPRPALPGPGVGGVLPQQPRPPAGRPQRLAHLRRRYSTLPGSPPRPGHGGPGFTTCATASPSPPCWPGTATAVTSRPGSRC